MAKDKKDKKSENELKKAKKDNRVLQRKLQKRDREIATQKKKVELKNRKDKDLLKEINKRGFLTIKREISQDLEYDFPEKVGSFKIGIVSDSHLGSCYQQLSHLKHFYKECKKEGIDTILHAGDFVEGNGKLYRGQMYEMFIHGASNQLKYIVKNYPKEKGITTHVIGGSHDYSFYKESGYNILEEIGKKRKDIKYLGMSGAFMNINGVRIYLMHGSGGVAYARSYKSQKIVEQLSPEQKPNILLLGHYHCCNYLPMYRNVEVFQLPCFQAQTPYLKGKALNPVIGAIILTINKSKRGLYSLLIDWRFYHKVVDHDY